MEHLEFHCKLLKLSGDDFICIASISEDVCYSSRNEISYVTKNMCGSVWKSAFSDQQLHVLQEFTRPFCTVHHGGRLSKLAWASVVGTVLATPMESVTDDGRSYI